MRSRTRVLRAAVIVVVAMVAVLAFSSGAYAAANTGCLTCHGTTLSVAVPDVNLVTLAACKACHIPGLVGSHPYHQPGANCAIACHPTWGDSLPTAIPSYSDPTGASFASANSKSTSPAVLHIIHSAPRWPANVSTTSSECGSCHQAAACNACHTGAVASTVVGGKAQHGIHSTLGKPASSLPIYPSWTGTVGRGVTGVDQTVNTIATETNQCAAAGCHNLEGTKANRSRIVEDYAYGVGGNPDDLTGTNAGVSYVGTWRVRYHSVYSGGRSSYNNVLGAELNATFTGTRVEVITDKDPYRGKAQVWVNGVMETALLDCYSATTVNGAVIFSKEFTTAGPHTISIRPTGTKSASARGAYVLIDGFSVYADLPESVAPDCISCHTAQAVDHGGDFSHEATHTAGLYSGFDCVDCHTINMFDEHGRSSSKTDAASCAACHTVYAGFALNSYDFTCGGTATLLTGATQPCHFAGQARHTFTEPTLIDASHLDTNATPSAALAECWSCHTKNLATIHNNSVTSNDIKGAAYVTSCLSCHGPSVFPTTADCTNAACHTVTGVHGMATHPAPPHMATNDGQGTVPRTGGKSCSTCHALEIANPAGGEHAKAASLTDPGAAAIGCVQCHSAPYFNSIKPWIDTTVPYTTNTCIACHKVASGLPGATTAGEPHELADYTSEHNYNAGLNTGCSSTTMVCHGGDTTLLGDIVYADTLHAASKPANADCTTCHTNNTAVPTQRQCSGAGCHLTLNHNTIPAHNSTGAMFATNADCLPCHADYDNLMFGHKTGSACVSCHDNTTLTATSTRYLNDAFTGECLGCHNATVIGTKTYYTADPNHYVETTHTAGIAADTVTTGGTVITTKACTACHSTKLQAEHVLTLSAANVNCIDCHTNAISTATIAANWLPGKKCANCHGGLHNSLGTSHDMSASAAALSCDGGLCHDGSNIAILHADRVLSTDAAKTSCNVCHANADTALTATACDSAGCHSGAGHSHPLTVPASTYSVAAQTGCVASGAGCHVDADTDYASLNYHPNAGCISGPCHTAANHNNLQFDNPNTCQNCHGGGALLYNNAPDVVATSGLQIADHYNETTHTATGLTNVVRGTTNGTASAACNACHDDSAPSGLNDLWYQHQGIRIGAGTGDLTCYACHNKSAEISTLVSDTTRTNTCAACHATGTGLVEAQHSGANAPVVNATSTNSCGASGARCHTTYDVHELHKNETKGCGTSDGTTNMVGCHDFRTQGIKPAAGTCGEATGCHAGYSGTHYNTPNHTSTTQGGVNYTLNGLSTTCGSCHSMNLNPEHSLTTSALTGSGSVCLRCHNNAGSDAAITGLWSGELCSSCHDGTGITAEHALVGDHDSVANAGCATTGVGCHPTNDLAMAGADKSVNIHNDCMTCHDPAGAASWTYGVAGNLKYNPLAKTCGGVSGCHTSGFYSTATKVHNIGQGASEVNGNDAKHTASAVAMATKVDSPTYSWNNACLSCHDDTLGTAHATTSMASDPSCSTGGTGDLGCHNSTALSNSPTQVKASWTSDTCADCHTTSHDAYNLGTHTSLVGASTADANDADSCVSGACHMAGATSDVRSMHDRSSSGCTATGEDSLLWSGGCHALNTPMPTGTIGCGKGTTADTGCHINHTNANHGLSAGGKPCYQCHGEYQAAMEDNNMTRTGAQRGNYVHHVMGSTTVEGDVAPNATATYPNTANDVFCVSCHTDHNYFNGATTKAANLRTTALTTSGAAPTNTDYIASGAYGVCVSCHATSLTKQGMGTDQLNVGASTTPVIQGADFNGSGHQYQVASAFGASSTFNANCSKCHSDEQTKRYATGTFKFGTHYSADAGVLNTLGTFTQDPPKEQACYKCHITAAGSGTDLKTVALKDAYGIGNMNVDPESEATFSEFAKTGSTHDLASVACINCHNVHEASAAAPVANPNNTLDVASIATTATVNTYCLACHDGTAPTQTINPTTLVPYTVTVAAADNISANYAADGHGPYIGCRDCHEQHGSGLRQLLRETVSGQAVSIYNDNVDENFCLACHRAGGAAASSNIARFYPTSVGGTKTQSAALPQAGGTRYGHRTKTAGVTAQGPLAAGSPLPCRTCHNAHGGKASGYMISVRTQVTPGVDTFIGDATSDLAMKDADQTVANANNVRKFCFTCHTTSDVTPSGWNGTAMATVNGGCLVVGIDRTGNGLKLPNIGTIPGHKATETTYNCYLCHGDDFSEDNSVNVHNPAAGESRGNIPCYTCHTVYQNRMEDGFGVAQGSQRTTSFHHVLGDGTTSQGDKTTNPTLGTEGTQKVFCLSCHVDHNKFSPLLGTSLPRAGNLRAQYDNNAATAASTDFNATGGGVCLGCHTAELTRDNTDQKPETNSTRTSAIASADYNLSKHQYTALSTFSDATTFNANCVKCHDSEIDGGGMEGGKSTSGFQTSNNKFSVHYSSNRRMLAAMGIALAEPPSEETVCYKCHSANGEGFKTTTNQDYYGRVVMDAASQDMYSMFAGTAPSNNYPSASLNFWNVSDGGVTGNAPSGDQSGDTYAGGTWQARLMDPRSPTAAYESYDTGTSAVAVGTQTWRRVRFVSPPVAQTVSVPAAAWNLSIYDRESSGNANARIRPYVYVWRVDNATKVQIVAPANDTEMGTTALPGTLDTFTTAAGAAVTLQPGDKIVVDVAIQTLTVATGGNYNLTYSWGSNAAGSLTAPTSIVWNAPAPTGPGHSVGSYAGIHRPSPTDETQTYISGNKHVECADCHDVHAAQATLHTRGTNAVGAASPLKGINGVDAAYTANSNWANPTGYSAVAAVTKEYQICFKCHSSANTAYASWGGTGAEAWTNVALDFNPNNASYHPVFSGLPTTDPGTTYGSSRLAAGDMRAAGTITTGGETWSVGGFANGSTMYCTDCHSGGATPAAYGPHGSAVKWMLAGPNKAWPYQNAANNGKSTGTYWTYGNQATGIDTANGLFCRNCHVLAGTAHTTGQHSAAACVTCHIRVPHGGKTGRLIAAYAAAPPSGMPARLSGNGIGGLAQAGMYSTGFSKANADGDPAAACGMTGCGSHGTVTSEPEW